MKKMNCKFTNAIVFAAGAVIGSAVTWMVLKTKYEQMVQEEIASVKEALGYMNNTESTDESETESEDEEEEPREEPKRPHQINWGELEDLDDEDFSEEELEEYASLTDIYSSKEGGAEQVVKDPYVISPYDYGEMDGYNTISLTYYADGVLEDDDHEIVTDIDELIGTKSLTTFGEYEDDSVFVRNERLRTDFEILKDYRTYKKAVADSPNRVVSE